MAGYIGTQAVSVNTTSATISDDLTVGDDLTVTDDAAIGGTLAVTGVLTTTAATVFNGGFASNDGSTITTADNSTQLTLISTDADASVGPVLDLFRNTTGASADEIGRIQFTGKNDAGTNHTFAQMYVKISDATSSGNTEDAQWSFDTIVAGTVRERMGIYQSGIIINQESLDSDFRVESNGNAHMLFVDGGTDRVGIGHAAPTVPFAVSANPGAVATPVAWLHNSGNVANYDGVVISSVNDGSDAEVLHVRANNSTYANGTSLMLVRGDGVVTVANSLAVGTTSASAKITSSAAGGTAYSAAINASGAGMQVTSEGLSNTMTALTFRTNHGAVGSITCGSATAYNTSSDYRLKENVVYDWDATTRLKQLKPARFNWIADDTNTTIDGFLAHEAQAVVPECVTGTKDEVDDDGVAVIQGIDQSKLVPLLVKTILELEARITALEA